MEVGGLRGRLGRRAPGPPVCPRIPAMPAACQLRRAVRPLLQPAWDWTASFPEGGVPPEEGGAPAAEAQDK